MLSVHTSPLDQPGTGDAGGLNVYVVEVAKRLSARGVIVDIFTRASRHSTASSVPVSDGVTVHHLVNGPAEPINKQDLPAELSMLTRTLLRHELSGPRFDAVHSHYWLSGHVGAVASDRWSVPLIHSMHTMAKVKNQSLAEGETPEPSMRVVGEQRVVDLSDQIIANTHTEKLELQRLYAAPPSRTQVVHPGVDLDTFSPGNRASVRRGLGLAQDQIVLLFVGRIQPLKGPDLLIRAAAELARQQPEIRQRLLCVICGGPSGAGPERQDELAKLAATLGVADLVRFVPPSSRTTLANWYRAADLVAVPSHSESFGLVAVEAQACGTPVIASDVGGLSTAVAHGTSGLLVADRDPRSWRDCIAAVVSQPRLHAHLAAGAREHATNFSWDATAAGTLAVYQAALRDRRSSGRGLTVLPA